MKTGVKIGFASSLAYIGLSFLPVFAQDNSDLNLGNIQTISQAKQVYQQKLVEYSQDKKINIKEIENLHSIIKKCERLEEVKLLELRKEHEDKKHKIRQQVDDLYSVKEILYSKKEGLLKSATELERKIDMQNEYLNDIKKEAAKNQQIFLDYEKKLENILKGVDNLFITHYPGVLKGTQSEYNTYYSADKELMEGVEYQLIPLIKKTHEIFKAAYQADDIKHLLHGHLTLKEMIAFRETLKSAPNIKPTPKDYNKLKKEQSEIIKQMILEKNQLEIKIQPELKASEIKLKDLKLKEEQLKRDLAYLQTESISVPCSFSFKEESIFKKYFERLDSIKSFINEDDDNVDLNKYFSLSLIDLALKYDDIDYIRARRRIGDGKELISELEDYFKNGGFDVKVDNKLPNPGKPKFPLWAIPLVLAAPIFRNMLLIKYLGGGKQTGDDYLISALMGGFLENITFYIFLDSLHPLVFPVRMIGIPLVWHGLLKVTGWDKEIYDYAK